MSLAELHSVGAASDALASQGYLADRSLALSVYLASTLEQPLLLEGEAGVGKTEVARALATRADLNSVTTAPGVSCDVTAALPVVPAPPARLVD